MQCGESVYRKMAQWIGEDSQNALRLRMAYEAEKAGKVGSLADLGIGVPVPDLRSYIESGEIWKLGAHCASAEQSSLCHEVPPVLY